MRGIAPAAAVFVGLAVAGQAFAQGPSSPLATAQPQRQAPVGHRQPQAKDLPADLIRREGAVDPKEREFDKRLDAICRGC